MTFKPHFTVTCERQHWQFLQYFKVNYPFSNIYIYFHFIFRAALSPGNFNCGDDGDIYCRNCYSTKYFHWQPITNFLG